MKKLLTALAVSGLFLAACAEESKPAEPEAEKAETVEEAPAEESKEEASGSKKELDEQIADSEIATIKLISIETESADFMPNDKHVLTFEIENKSDQKIGLQMRDLSINNEMVSEEHQNMHGEATPGKTAKVKLEIESYEEGTPTPELVGKIEGALLVLDAETFEDIEYHDFSIDLGE
ncbi:hypothetical protein FE331_07720 [Dolosigranulum pigrum]|uniref:hypothetical protein n=1 Tax=Dolosigranulum pigrum TaxID=29394 RepID=UPI001AD87F1B|nr:hypothetical protein [Dolosigranulum pigrum]QTJ50517.1 hypothetical protein FE331_07720 [Dolosigranulum pigrum]